MAAFSLTLVQRIEAGAEQIADCVIEEVRNDPRLPELRSLPEHELKRRALHILRNLGHWLVAEKPEVAEWSESLGRARYEQSIPLHEIIRALAIIKSKLIDFARDGMAGTTLEIYAEEELA